ncbi:MAG: ABC transporter substrate-binding protein [Eubacteriales bacterium]|nr:ABC transporter substrate-binding protein [Eubacteriales bacterium]
MKKSILIAALSLMTASSLAFGVSAAEYENCTLTLDWWGGDSRHEATQQAVEAFMDKYPGIDVKVNFGAWSDWETAKAAEYMSGNNPDVQQINFDWISKYDGNGTTYLDLNEVASVVDLEQFDSSILESCQDVNGGIAAVPNSLTGRVFYWNEATYAAAGIEVPTSLEELLAAGPVFQEKLGDNYYPLVLGQYDRAILMAFYLQAQTGEPIINEDGNFTLTEDQVKEGLEWICSLEDAHVIPTIAYIAGEGADSFDKSARFINGEYAGILEWDSSAAKFISALGDNSANLVVGNEFEDLGSAASGVFSKIANLFAISAKTEHPTEAALLLNYLVNDPEATEILGIERGIPESKIAYETVSAAGKIDEVTAAAHNAFMSADPMYWNPLFDDSSLKGSTSLYSTVFEQLSYGMDAAGAEYTVEQAASDLYNGYIAVAPAK